MTTQQQTFITTGQIARMLLQPEQRVRRVVDRLWPGLPRAGKSRLIPATLVCEIAAQLVTKKQDER